MPPSSTPAHGAPDDQGDLTVSDIQESLEGILEDLVRIRELWAAGESAPDAVDAVVDQMADLHGALLERRAD